MVITGGKRGVVELAGDPSKYGIGLERTFAVIRGIKIQEALLSPTGCWLTTAESHCRCRMKTTAGEAMSKKWE
jgi:hypothetical protein